MQQLNYCSMSKDLEELDKDALNLLAIYRNRIRDRYIDIHQDGKFHPWDIEDDIERFTEEFHSLPESIQTELRRVIKEYNELGENEEQQNERSLEEIQMKDGRKPKAYFNPILV